MQNFDLTPVLVCTVDAESLRKIATHNFEKSKNPKIALSPMDGGPSVYLA